MKTKEELQSEISDIKRQIDLKVKPPKIGIKK
jgi:hypothetical protein